MPERLRVGVVGLGGNGRAFAELYARHPKATLAAVCDLNPERVRQVAEALAVPGRFTDDAIYAADLDLISIHTPDPLHVAPFVKALQGGKHVFVEKPMGNTRADLDAMTAAAAAHPHLKVMVGQILRFNPFFARLKEMAAAGDLGEIFFMEADYIHDLHVQADPERFNPHLGMNWYLEQEIPLVGGGVHPFDLLRWYAGCNAVEVEGFANRFAFPEMKNPDCQVALFRFENGAIAKVAAAYGPVGPMPPFYGMRIYGTKGTVMNGRVCLGHGHEYTEQDLTGLGVAGHPYDPEVDHVLTCILEDRPTLVDAFEGANSTIAVIVGAEAATQGVKLPVPQYRRPGEGVR